MKTHVDHVDALVRRWLELEDTELNVATGLPVPVAEPACRLCEVDGPHEGLRERVQGVVRDGGQVDEARLASQEAGEVLVVCGLPRC